MELHVQCAFAGLYAEFKENQHTMDTVAKIVELSSRYSEHMTSDAKRMLLEIPRCVLKHQAKLKCEDGWAASHARHYSGNAQYDEYAEVFAKGEFSFDTIIEYFEYILEDDARLSNDFKLRNIEVTIRDDVSPANLSNFEKSGPIFARVMEKAFEL